MNQTLAGLQPQQCMVYLDDIIIRSATFEQHLQDLRAVFDRLRNNGLKLKLKKCAFAMATVEFLGHIVSAEGLAPDPAKVTAVRNLAPPTCVKGVRSFLGMAGYYRRFISHFAIIARPLFNLLKRIMALTGMKAVRRLLTH